MTTNKTHSVDDEHGNQITTGLDGYGAALQSARRYLSAHEDAPSVTVYTDDESWDLTRAEVLG
jgi:hypothetical protein